MQITYAMHANLEHLRIPPPATRARTDGLWRHTCFELFIRCASVPAYYELNFSPSGAWAAFSFTAYREGGAPAEQAVNPRVEVRSSENNLTLDALVPLEGLYAHHASVRLEAALAAVVEERDGRLTYWALRHAPGKPDFHHPSAYALEPEACPTAVSAS